jgi:cytochrome c2
MAVLVVIVVIWCTACAARSTDGALGGNPERGRQTIAAVGCGSCHTIDGVTGADGLIGPPLTGIASRSIIAGRLPNTPENMLRWITNAPSIEPGVAMPAFVGATPQSARDVVAYLYTLK